MPFETEDHMAFVCPWDKEFKGILQDLI